MKHSEVAKIFWTDIGICGCGNPISVIEKIKEVLNILDMRTVINVTESKGDWAESFVLLDKSLNIIDNNDQSFYYLMLYTLDKLNLTEHGVSCRGCWLTDKGHELLIELNNHTIEEIMEFDEYEEENNNDNSIKKKNYRRVGIEGDG